MELSREQQIRSYNSEIDIIESYLDDAAKSDNPEPFLASAQSKLDLLAQRYQENKSIGKARYKLYEHQAIIHWMRGDYVNAKQFIHEAITMHGASYKQAEQLLESIELQVTVESTPAYEPNQVLFFARSPLAVMLLILFTANTYLLYWSFRHWKEIQNSKGERTYPILAAIFQLFTTYPLFRQIKDAAQESGYTRFRKARSTAAGFLIFLYSANAVWRAEPKTTPDGITMMVGLVLLCAIVAIFAGVVQRAANAHNEQVQGQNFERKGIMPGEVILTIVGVLFVLLATFGVWSTVNEAATPSRSPAVTAAYDKMESLRGEYTNCNNGLEAKRGSVDTYNASAVDGFNTEQQACESKRLELNTAVDEYNKLIGY